MRPMKIYPVLLFIGGLSVMAMAQSGEEAQIKSAKEFYSTIKGDWTGTYNLWLRPGMAAEISDTYAEIMPAVKDDYYLMIYSWARGETEHKGLFLLGGNRKKATADL